jgi:hypothetical protein
VDAAITAQASLPFGLCGNVIEDELFNQTGETPIVRTGGLFGCRFELLGNAHVNENGPWCHLHRVKIPS